MRMALKLVPNDKEFNLDAEAFHFDMKEFALN
jgi:hypothetical protein